MLHLISEAVVTPQEWTSLLTQGGAIGVLAFVVICFLKGWIVSGGAFKEACAQRDRALDQVYRLAEQTSRESEMTRRIVAERREA